MPPSAGRSPNWAACGRGWPAMLGSWGSRPRFRVCTPRRWPRTPRVSPAERYQLVHRTMRGIARREPTFALHVHIGVADPESAIRLLNRLRAHLPLLLALSASSPLWRGRATGLASNRTILFQAFPRTGLPRHFDGLRRLGAHRRPAPALGRDPGADLPVVGRATAAPLRHHRSTHHGRPTATAGHRRPVRARASRLPTGARGGSRPPTWHTPRKHSQRTASSPPATASTPNSSTRPGAQRIPLADLLANLLAQPRPHAHALHAADELAAIPALVAAPEATRQETRAARSGIPAVVADLASRFSAAAGGPRASLGLRPHSWQTPVAAVRRAFVEGRGGLGRGRRGLHWCDAAVARVAARRRRGRRPRCTARPAGHGLRRARGRAGGHRALRDARAARRVLPVGPVADPRAGTGLGGLPARRRGNRPARGRRRHVGADRAGRDARHPRRGNHVRRRPGAVRVRHRTAVDARAPRLPDGYRRDGHRRAASQALRVLGRDRDFLRGVRDFVAGLDETMRPPSSSASHRSR